MRTKLKSNPIPAGSMADIAFLLLIFFLVTTTILDEKGIMVKLPAWDPEAPTAPINERNVLNIYLNASNELMVETEFISIDQLTNFIKSFITNPDHSDQKPVAPSQAIISLKNDRSTAYAKYIAVYDAIMSAYLELQNEKARELFGRQMEGCSDAEKRQVKEIYPMVISEMEEADLPSNSYSQL